MKARTGKKGFVYRSYSFVDKDPVIDRVHALMDREHLSYSDVSALSGVASATLRNWIEGQTRRPQYATVAAAVSGMGYTQKFVRAKNVNYERAIAKAKEEIQAAAAK